MTRPLRLAIHGASGRMGRALLALVREDPRFVLTAALSHEASASVGQPVFPGVAALAFSADWEALDSCDVLIDFSNPAGLSHALQYCAARKIALLSGTTGLEPTLERQLHHAGQQTALLHAANFSLGIAVLTRLVRQAAAALPDWDLEIIEAHHARKEDAPSGTALALGEAAAAARGSRLASEAVYNRHGRSGRRRSGSIGFAVVRGGHIIGEHQALLIGPEERIELSHRATDRAVFARGALEAAYWLATQRPGLYSLEHMLAARMAP